MADKKRMLGVAGAVIALGLLFWLAFMQPPPASVQSSRTTVASLPPTIAKPASSPVSNAPQISSLELANQFERATDLRELYERYRDSPAMNERHTAYRAWMICFPAFLPPEDAPITAESMLNGLPKAAQTPQRLEAVRGLLGRCQRFFTLSRQTIIEQTHVLQDGWLAGKNRAEGERVLQQWESGDEAGAKREARKILLAGDAYAVFSLHEFFNRYSEKQQHDEKGDAMPFAFYLAPCDLGLECGPQSLTALQLCAVSLACNGSVAERYASIFADEIDSDRLHRAVPGLLNAIRGRDLTLLGL